MLDEQFFGNKDYHKYINDNYIAIHAYKNNPQAGQDLYKDLGAKFGIIGTPTVIIAQADGKEINRILGYPGDPERMKTGLNEALNAEDSFMNLEKAIEKNPKDVSTLVKLAKAYEDRRKDDEAAKLYAAVLNNPAEAKKIMLPYGRGRNAVEVSAYEMAKFAGASADAKNILSFLNEFPESPMKNSVISGLSRMYTDENNVNDAIKVFKKLFAEDPENYSLVNGFISFATRSQTNLDDAVKVAEKFYSTETGQSNNRFPSMYAGLLVAAGDLNTAMNVYGEDFMKANSDNINNMMSYAMFWANQGTNLESALKASTIALENNDFSPNRQVRVFDTHATVLTKMGKFDDAIKICEKALQIAPDNQRMIDKIASIKVEKAKKG
ncbi:tetratricopeptide repeat protein [candidate division KSB1 bacterium]